MSTAGLDYPLGRSLVPAAAVRRDRVLPSGAAVRVTVGEQVRPDQPIAQVTSRTGAPVALLAGMAGRVTEIGAQRVTLEGSAMLLQGVLGMGGSVVGPLTYLPRGESLAVVPIQPGGVIVLPQQLPLTFMQRAAAGGAAAIVAPSTSARELEAFARTDLTALLDGLAPRTPPMPLPIVLTEGFGAVPMQPALYHVLAQRLGDIVLVTGTTDPKRNIRPDVLLPVPPATPAAQRDVGTDLREGEQVYVVAGSRRGARGTMTHIYDSRQYVEGGILAPCVAVTFEDGHIELIALHALERAA